MVIGRAGAGGFTYVGLLLFIAIAGIGLAVVGQVWHTEAQREREKELLFTGEQFAQAIGSYYENTPDGPKQYPASLQDLLLDKRFPTVRHHLRKLYLDPMTGDEQWGLVMNQGRITGVYSRSRMRPIKTLGFSAPWAEFTTAKTYEAWQFVYVPGSMSVAQLASQGATGASGGQPGVAGSTSVPGDTDSADPVVNQPEKSGAGGAGPPSSSPEADYARKQLCLGQRVSDTAACTFYCKETGVGAECRRCQASIFSRYKACLNADSIPALADGS